MNYEENAMPEGKLEMLEKQVEQYLAGPGDKMLTEYLVNFKKRVRNQRVQIELLQDELERSYQMYLRRVEVEDRAAQQMVLQEITEEQLSII